MEELIWKDVVGYEEYFSISSKGDVFSKRSGKILKQHSTSRGRSTVSTRINGRKGSSICFLVHRLVAVAFIPNPENKPEVNHIDGSPSNNDFRNLEWVTRVENILHAYKTGLMKQKKGLENINCKLSKEQISWIKENCEPRSRTKGIRALARKFSVSHPTILRILNI
jgi:hypothetical protein